MRTNIAHGKLCVPLLSKAAHQGKSGLPPCVCDLQWGGLEEMEL